MYLDNYIKAIYNLPEGYTTSASNARGRHGRGGLLKKKEEEDLTMKINFWFGRQHAKDADFALDNGMHIVHTEYNWYVYYITDEGRGVTFYGDVALALIKVLMAH